ncbi:MAG: C40 family peptidase [Hydrogenophilaceae bacterium]|nr:C40 family peptidase [Hydrogenophilaceae bacterium]
MKQIVLLALTLPLCTVVYAGETPPAKANQEIPFYALSLVGTPYRFGGTDPETGFDCSGFVGHVFREAAGVRLPRSSQEMSRHDLLHEITDLQPGDLVFFNTLNQAFSHVGVYIGDSRFVHASSSQTRTVMVSDMTHPYWSRRYEGARRLIFPLDKHPGQIP